MKKIFLAILFVCTAFLVNAGIKLDPAKSYTVVYPVKPTVQERYAARLLAEYLSKMTKTTISAKREDRADGNLISVGNTDLAKEAGFTKKLRLQGYSVDVKGKNVFIRGGHPGPLNGVISFMQEDLGFRYYAEPQGEIPAGKDPGLVVIPDLSNKALEVTARSYTPPFEARELLYNYAHKSNPEAVMFLRLAPLSYLSYLPEESGGVENSNLFVHTYYELIPAKKYYATHPEYFSLLNGKRVKQTAHMGSVCYTHPEIPKLMAEYVRNLIKKTPNARYFSISCNDGSTTACECENCKPLIKKHGLPGVQLMIANKVAELLVKDYPDIRLTTLVYGHGKLHTGGITAHPNVVLFLAPIGSRYNNVMMLVPLPDNPQINKNIDDCFKSCDNVYFWDYLETDDMPYPSFDQFAKSVKLLAEKDITGYFADCSNGGKSLTPLKKWVYSQLLWNPDQDIEKLIPEFVNAFYGKAAPEMLEYIALIRKAWNRFAAARKAAGDGVSLIYSADEISRMTAIFERALKKTEKDPVHYGRIAREYIPLLRLKLSANPTVIGVENYKTLLAKAKSLAKYVPARATMKRSKWVGKWEKKLAWSSRAADPAEYSRNTVTVWKPLAAGRLAAHLDDKAAAKGRAARHIGKKPWGIQWYYTEFIEYLTPGKVYVIRLRARAEQKTLREKGKMFDMRAHHHGNEKLNRSQPLLFGTFDKAKDSTGKYRIFVLGKLIVKNPQSTGMFWMNSLVNRDEGVWYERLELIPLDEYKEKEPVPDKLIVL
ncbi:MAG: DUF4838 domain-containing protein [Lentisphaeria bacterium]|nr:DUF4838 domain-containing protein [Lentisphaeria bacterium]